MKPADYLAALHAAGIPDGLPVLELDRQAALLLGVGRRTARRYRQGDYPVPQTIRLALKLLAAQRRLTAEAFEQEP
jgi:hypothetical protein